VLKTQICVTRPQCVKMLTDILGIVCEDSNIIEVGFSFGSRSVETLLFFF